MSFCGFVVHLFLYHKNSIPLYAIYIHLLKGILFASNRDNYELIYYKHLCVGFFVWI